MLYVEPACLIDLVICLYCALLVNSTYGGLLGGEFREFSPIG